MNSLKIVLIGAGNVATHLGKALNNKGHQVVQVFSKKEENAAILADQIGAEPIINLKNVTLEADFYLLAVKDDRIEEICQKLNLGDKLIAHTSGTIALEVLKNSSKNTGVFYPLQTFSKFKKLDLKTVPFCIEGNNEASSKLLFDLANELSPTVELVDSDKRKKIHLAAVFACNFSNHMYAIAEKLLEKDGMSLDLIRPLLEETTRKAIYNSPSEVQTGPAIRNDEDVMINHQSMLESMPNWKEIYQLISKSIQQTDK